MALDGLRSLLRVLPNRFLITELGIGNRELRIGNWELRIGKLCGIS
ncbi:hypothetical protein [Microcoleus sp. S13_C5]